MAALAKVVMATGIEVSDRLYEVVNSVPNWTAANLIRNGQMVPTEHLGGGGGGVVGRDFLPPQRSASDSYPSIDSQQAPPPLPPSRPMRQRSSNSEGESVWLRGGDGGGSSAGSSLSSLGKGGGPPCVERSYTCGSMSSSGSSNDSGSGTFTMKQSPSLRSFSSPSEELQLSEFIKRYSSRLPTVVKVAKGFYGVSDQTAITTGDKFVLHFTKNTKVMIAVGEDGRSSFSFPLNSSIQFGLIFNPNNNLEAAKKGLFFTTIAEICAMKILPKVICATKAYHGNNAESSVGTNEILIVLSSKSTLGKKQLKVHSVTMNKRKTLPENTAGHFSTAPWDIRMTLQEIRQYVSCPFPCKAVICPSNDLYSNSLTEISNTVVTLNKVNTEASVIATGYSEEDDIENAEIIEMPVDLDIEVEASLISDKKHESLIQSTRYLFDSFHPLTVTYYMNKSTVKLYDIQCLLYKTVSDDGDFKGLEMIRPPLLTKKPTGTSHLSHHQYHHQYHHHHHHHPDVSQGGSSSGSNGSPPPPPTNANTVGTGSGHNTTGSDLAPPVLIPRRSSIKRTEPMPMAPRPRVPERSNSTASTTSPASHPQTDYVLMTPPREGRGVVGGMGGGGGGGEHLGFLSLIKEAERRMEESRREHERRVGNEISKMTSQLAKLSEDLRRYVSITESVSNKCDTLQRDVDRLLQVQGMKSYDPTSEGLYDIPNFRGPQGNKNGVITVHTGPRGVSPPQGGGGGGGCASEEGHNSEESNRECLRGMDHTKIVQLLDVMSMRQYRDSFAVERITGEILADCDEEMLEKDLGISSKLHRMRLLKIISGRHNAAKILSGEDPYASRK